MMHGWPLAWPWLALGLALAGPWPGPWLALGLALGWPLAPGPWLALGRKTNFLIVSNKNMFVYASPPRKRTNYFLVPHKEFCIVESADPFGVSRRVRAKLGFPVRTGTGLNRASQGPGQGPARGQAKEHLCIMDLVRP